MKILAIDTSCDETAVAITEGRKILSNEMYSQILLHKKWGGVVPDLAKRAHEEHIDEVVESALKKAKVTMKEIDAIAVTYGPGLAIALGVGIKKAQEMCKKYDKKLIAINHMEGHIYSCFAQNTNGNPAFDFAFPYIALLVSGGHTELVLFKDHIEYEIVGEKLDDAAGEALDKGARLIVGAPVYPGGEIVEQLAKTGDPTYIRFPRPMERSMELNFSYSGLKTALLYEIRKLSDDKRIARSNDLAAAYQEAVFDSLLIKLKQAMIKYKITDILVGGGVSINAHLRTKIRSLVKKQKCTVHFPPIKSLNGDNAAMIGIAGYYKAQKGMFVENIDGLDRDARARLGD